jgi:hypothetical protein
LLRPLRGNDEWSIYGRLPCVIPHSFEIGHWEFFIAAPPKRPAHILPHSASPIPAPTVIWIDLKASSR